MPRKCNFGKVDLLLHKNLLFLMNSSVVLLQNFHTTVYTGITGPKPYPLLSTLYLGIALLIAPTPPPPLPKCQRCPCRLPHRPQLPPLSPLNSPSSPSHPTSLLPASAEHLIGPTSCRSSPSPPLLPPSSSSPARNTGYSPRRMMASRPKVTLRRVPSRKTQKHPRM